MPTSNYLGNKLLDHVIGDDPYSPPGTVYIALYTSMPTPSTSGTEVAGGSYVRVAVTNNLTNFPAASGKTKSNGTAITFPQATASWGAVVGVAVVDASTAGNILMFAQFASPRTVAINDTPSFNTNQLTFTAV
jgi:hypothetical protein